MLFVTANTQTRVIFSKNLDLQDSFLEVNPEVLLTNPDTASCILKQEMVFEHRVADDTAERGVALMQEYNDLLTKDEGQLNLLFLSSRNTASCTTIATMLLSFRVSLLLRTKLLGLDSKSRMDL